MSEKRTKKAVIPVIVSDFKQFMTQSVDDLFDGFDELRAVTFSSGIGFMRNVLNKFNYAEVIFGCADIINTAVKQNLAMKQKEILNVNARVCDALMADPAAAEWAERIDAGTLKFYVTRQTRSHEKIYILKAHDGRSRIITGSANFSGQAFDGRQREVVIVFDNDDAALDYFEKRFVDAREMCADYISTDVIKAKHIDGAADIKDMFEELPVVKTLDKTDLVVLMDPEPVVEESEPMVYYTSDLNYITDEMKESLPKPPRIKKSDKSVILIANDAFKAARAKILKARMNEQAREFKLPRMRLNIDEGTLVFDDKLLDLHPDKEKISSDIKCLISFLEGLSIAHGDYKRTQRLFFMLTVWFFSSLFFPYMRLIADIHDYEYVPHYPMYCLIYGKSNGGKSKVIKLLNKMMTGHDVVLMPKN